MNLSPRFPQIIDNSLRSDFVACPRKFFYSGIRRLVSAAGTNIHLHAGGCFAKGIETTRIAFYVKKLSQLEAVLEGAAAMVEFWGDYEAPGGSTKTLDRMLGALDFYFESFPMSIDYVLPLITNNKAAVEFSFALPIPEVTHPETGEPLIYAGRFDMVGIYNNLLFVVDEKTTSSLGPSWSAKWDLRAQFTGYCWAARTFHLPVVGTIIRGISILKTKYDKAEAISYRPDWEIDRWYKQLIRDLNRMKALYLEGYWDYNISDACESFGGCSFKRLCTSPEPENILPSYYIENTWNPLKNDLAS